MELTTESLARFVGGGVEIRSLVGNYLYKGMCLEIDVEADTLCLRFTSLVKNKGGPYLPSADWQQTHCPDYLMSLIGHTVHDLRDGRLCLELSLTNESIVFSPPGTEDPNRSRVQHRT